MLFRGGAEGGIRKRIIGRGVIKGIIGLPANLFYGTGIPACIIVLDKENASARKAMFMIDASKGFIKDGPKNRLREQDIHRIVDTFTRQLDVPGYARLVPVSEIADAKNDLVEAGLPRPCRMRLLRTKSSAPWQQRTGVSSLPRQRRRDVVG